MYAEQSTEALCTEFAQLAEEKRLAKDSLEDVSVQCADLEKELLARFQSGGLTKIGVLVGQGRSMTVSLRRELWASRPHGVEPQPLCDALKAAGLSDLVRESYQSNTLSSWMRELERDENDMPILPPELEGVLVPVEKFSVRALRS